MAQEATTTIAGQEVTITIIDQRSGGGSRVDIETDNRRWRVDVTGTGEIDEVVTTWEHGELRDLDVPDWIDDVLAQLARPV